MPSSEKLKCQTMKHYSRSYVTQGKVTTATAHENQHLIAPIVCMSISKLV